jgi:hypothetical protein
MTDGKNEGCLIVLGDFAAKFESSAQFEFCVTVEVERKGVRSGFEDEVCVEKKRIFVQKFASVAALRDLNRRRARAAGAEQIAIANLHTGQCAFVSIEPDPKTELFALGFLS